jgi:hypothetical protein
MRSSTIGYWRHAPQSVREWMAGGTVTASGRTPSSALLPQPFSWTDHLVA